MTRHRPQAALARSDTRRRAALAAVVVLAATACAHRGGRGRPVEWASVPACQGAIRARVLTEFGHGADVDFQGVAEEKRWSRRVRVRGRLTVETSDETIPLTYECITIPRKGRLVSATYTPAD